MKIRTIAVSLIIMLILCSCTVKPAAISYGNDACAYCKMTIVDKQHAAQMVTKKGKPYKYDAIECMLHDIEDKDSSDFKFLLVTNYQTPAQMIDAVTASYLVSETIQSPMGANLSAFVSDEKALPFVKKANDKLYNWQSLQKYFYGN